MKSDNKYDPLCLSANVQERIDKKASGCTVNISKASKPLALSNSSMSRPQQNSLKDDFLEMLFPVSPESHTPSNSEKTPKNTGNFQTNGTKELFSPLKKGEVKEKGLSEIQNSFSFQIDNSALGALEVKGSYNQGNLLLNIELPPAMGLNEQKVLIKILEAKLSKQLGVALEVKIGRSN